MSAKPAAVVTWNPYEHLRKHPRSRYYRVRFSHARVRYEESTGKSDIDEAAAFAVDYHAKVVSGQHKPPVRIMGDASTPLDEIGAEWLADIKYESEPWLIYLGHWSRFFKTLGGLCTPGAIERYWASRLSVVKRRTVGKETAALGDLLLWLREQKLVTAPVPLPELPSAKRKKNQGVNYHLRRRGKATPITSEQARAIIDELPEWSKRRTNRFPVRARYEVAYETGLRPTLLARLTVPRHYTKGSPVLRITKDIDKVKFDRDLPLSDVTRRWLDSVCPAEGLIFGRHDFRHVLGKAVAAAKLPAHLAETFTTYDFKHRAATEMASTGDLPGVAFLMGWKQITTANKYARPDEVAATRVLEKRRQLLDSTVRTSREPEPEPQTPADPSPPPAAATPVAAPSASAAGGSPGVLAWGTPSEGGLEGVGGDAENLNDSMVCAKERTRTSTGVTPLAPQSLVGVFPQSFQGTEEPPEASGGSRSDGGWGTTPGEAAATDILPVAVAILSANALGEPISRDQVVGLARAALASTQVGRLALEVLDGGPRAPAAAVQLACLVSKAAVAATDSKIGRSQ